MDLIAEVAQLNKESQEKLKPHGDNEYDSDMYSEDEWLRRFGNIV